MTNTRRFALALLLNLAAVGGRPANAAATISIDPNTPVKLGYSSTLTVSGMTPNFTYSLAWFSKENDDYVQPQWQAGPTGQTSITVFHRFPATWVVKCTVTYNPTFQQPAPPAEEPTITYTVPKPDSSAVFSGLNQDAGYDTAATNPTDGGLNGSLGVPLWIQIFAGSDSVGPYADLGAQEKITNMRAGVPLPADPQPDSDWVPAGASALFRLDRTTYAMEFIFDWKKCLGVPTNVSGVTFATYTQENRVIWTNANGDLKTASVGTLNLKCVTTGATTWQTQAQ